VGGAVGGKKEGAFKQHGAQLIAGEGREIGYNRVGGTMGNRHLGGGTFFGQGTTNRAESIVPQGERGACLGGGVTGSKQKGKERYRDRDNLP